MMLLMLMLMLLMISMMLMLMFTWPRSGSLGSGLHTDSWLPKLQNFIVDETIFRPFCDHFVIIVTIVIIIVIAH